MEAKASIYQQDADSEVARTILLTLIAISRSLKPLSKSYFHIFCRS